jgi:hypothetical protein
LATFPFAFYCSFVYLIFPAVGKYHPLGDKIKKYLRENLYLWMDAVGFK